MPIPKPLCQCRVCREAREKGYPFRRTGPSLFLHNQNLLIDTPADIAGQLNREGIRTLKTIMFTHLDPDHTEGLRVIEQITLDFCTWRGRTDKQISLQLPRALIDRFYSIKTVYGPWLEFLEKSGFVECSVFEDTLMLGDLGVTAIRVPESDPPVFIYVFVQKGFKIVYAPCDIKPFPEYRPEVQNSDLLLIQPGIFETGLANNYRYPEEHISRTTLYTFDETLALGRQLNAGRIVFVHLEEYWNRSFSDYRTMEKENLRFAYDGMTLDVCGNSAVQ
jgi:phosphoribosyl 1,2-cyclic phosphate phosphodiesterase